MLQQNTDYLIIGSGIIGLSLALSILKNTNKKVILITNQLAPKWNKDKINIRVSSLNFTSVEFYKKLNIFDKLLSKRINFYDKLQFINSNGNNILNFTKQDCKIDYLGVMIENCLLIEELLTECKTYPNFQLIVEEQQKQSFINNVWIINTNNHQIITPIVFACDGANSIWKKLAAIPSYKKTYPTSCMLINITNNKNINITWQRIANNGPRAFLPISESNAILCLYDTNENIKKYQSYTQQQIYNLVKNEFYELTDEFEVLEFASFPLSYQHATTYYNNNVFLIGDSAHLINPMAGQGINISIINIETLIKLMEELNFNLNFNNIQELGNTYTKLRKLDNSLMLQIMDKIHNFSTKQNIITNIINKINIDNKSIIQKYIAQYYLGQRQHLDILKKIINISFKNKG